MKKYLLIIAIAGLVFAACDKIEEPYKNTGQNGDPVEETTRKVLLEEYTGHTCVNCPRAAITASELKALYGDRLILLSVHVGPLAAPGLNPFTKDFRSDVGNAWDAFFSVSSSGVPLGIINRKSEGGVYFTPPGNWGTSIAQAMEDEESIAKIDISTNYNAGNRQLGIGIETTFLTNASGNFMVQALIVEDNVVAPQRNNDPSIGPGVITNYNHRHVLRGSANGLWGESLLPSGTNLEVGAAYSKEYTYTVNPDWDAENVYVVVMVYDNDTKEVLQVERTSFVGL